MAKYILGKIAPIQQGFVAKGNTHWLLNLDMVESNTGRVLDYLYVKPEEIGNSTIMFDTGNVLYSKLRPYLNKVVLPNREGYATSEMLPLRPDTSIITREYLTYYLRSPHFLQFINGKTSGAKMPRANVSDLMALEIECPTIERQQQITTILEKTTSLIKLYNKELQLLEDLARSQFVEMFGTINKPAYGCEIHTIQDVCELVKDGTHQTPEYTDDGESGYIFLSSKDVVTGKIDWDHTKYIPEYLHKELYSKIAPRRGDILLAKNGTTGIAAVVDRDEVFDIYVSLAWLRPKVINSIFLCAAINNYETKRQFNSSLKGIGVPNLHLGEIKKTRIVVGPLERQNQFASFVQQLDKSKLAIQKNLDELQLLYDSLMQEYFG